MSVPGSSTHRKKKINVAKQKDRETERERQRDREREMGPEVQMTHEFPVDVPEERMAHDVSKACLRVAAQTLLGILRENQMER